MGLKKINNTSYILALILPVLVKCTSSSHSSDSIKFDSNEINKVLDQNGDNIALLSCLRCGCFVDAYNSIFKKSGKKPEGYVLLADTLCNKFLFPVINIPAGDFEKISDEIYNLTLFKRRNKTITTKILQVEDSKKMEKIITLFFKE